MPVMEKSIMSGSVASRCMLLWPARSSVTRSSLRPEARHRLLAHPRLQRRLDVVEDRLVERVQ